MALEVKFNERNSAMAVQFDSLQIQKIEGLDGLSAYELAVKNGFEGTEEQWLASLEGEPGCDGVSPTVNVTEITGGHQVTITDATNTHTFQVMDGKNGKDGEGGGITFETDETLTLANGILSVNTAKDVEQDNTLPVTSAAVKKAIEELGSTGGGKTPVRGEDYWTAEDIATIKGYVDDAILNGAW